MGLFGNDNGFLGTSVGNPFGGGNVAGDVTGFLENGGFIGALYNGISGILTPPKPQLANPATAGAPPTQGQISADQSAATLTNEQAMSKSYSYLPFSEGLDSGSASNGPRTTSQTLLGS